MQLSSPIGAGRKWLRSSAASNASIHSVASRASKPRKIRRSERPFQAWLRAVAARCRCRCRAVRRPQGVRDPGARSALGGRYAWAKEWLPRAEALAAGAPRALLGTPEPTTQFAYIESPLTCIPAPLPGRFRPHAEFEHVLCGTVSSCAGVKPSTHARPLPALHTFALAARAGIRLTTRHPAPRTRAATAQRLRSRACCAPRAFARTGLLQRQL